MDVRSTLFGGVLAHFGSYWVWSMVLDESDYIGYGGLYRIQGNNGIRIARQIFFLLTYC
jgi:hypothetical protein